ncbi:MAG: efflux RND transporter periplasmic adaptor subunit [Pirellulaceae bacterium]|nr:efflux RND transporter periplasmic adaptor subunit [Pirellulaceae bacterium]
MTKPLISRAEAQLQSDDLTGCLDRLELLTGADEQVLVSEGTTAATIVADRIVDWNRFQPDGTDEAIDCLLQMLTRRFDATVFLGHLSRAGHAKQIYCSDQGWATLKRKPLWLRNLLVEAAHSSVVIGSSQAFGTLTAVLVQANRELASAAVMGLGLQLDPGQPNFGCALAFKETLTLEQAESLAVAGRLLADELRPWIRAWHHNYVARRWISRGAKVLGILQANPRRVGIGALAFTALMMSPLPYWPQRACLIEPMVRQYVSSPLEGRVLESFVKPGDKVEKGQVLARLDEDELRWSLESAQAEYEATAKKRDIGLASKSSGNMRVAQLELQQIAVRIDAIKANLERLTVRSPIDGIVLQGDWFRSQGAPVSRGDTLFEVAPLDRMTVETHLSTEDLAEIHAGDQATLRVDANQNQVWTGQLERIDPRAKVIDDQVIFVAELEIQSAGGDLKPGMKGSVTLSSGYRSIGWLLFHRPYRWLLKKMFW